jgi:hydroxymethylpyrimidine pyrophosphatase-like HAD family hydrolase
MISLPLKLSLDYHGVISHRPAYFTEFCAEAHRRGHAIYVITGGPLPQIRQYLAEIRLKPDFIFAISDYYQALGQAVQVSDGSLSIPPDLWNIAKADFCRRCGVDFHIDDSIEYQHWFSTPFCLYDVAHQVCRISKTHALDFALNPTELLNEIEKTVSFLGARKNA